MNIFLKNKTMFEIKNFFYYVNYINKNYFKINTIYQIFIVI